MFLLSTYADGTYWKSSIEPLLCPTGCSFYRPFSYRAKYLTDALKDTFRNSDSKKRFLSDEDAAKGLFGITFSHKNSGSEFYDKFIPLRHIYLTDVQGDEEFHVYFRLGDYVSLTAEGVFKVLSLEEVVNVRKPDVKLMFDIPKASNLSTAYHKLWKANCRQATHPIGLWDRFY
jgi:hypothetical protein